MVHSRNLTVRLSGGLGNQLFKVLASIKVARDVGNSILVDSSWYKTKSNLQSVLDSRQVEISQFPEIASLVSFVERDSYEKIYRLLRKLPTGLQVGIGYATDKNILSFRDPCRIRVMDGNFMRVSLLPDDELLKKLLKFPKFNATTTSSLDSFEKKSFIAVHVRRGDYTRLQSIYGILTPSYYAAALSKVHEKLGKQPLILFSDDPESSISWLCGTLEFEQVFESSQSESSVHTLMAMSMAKGIIASNSTYSWWAAKIGELNGFTKSVVCPKSYQKLNGSEVAEGLKVSNWEYISTGVLDS